jgi:Rieske 2Fe-2S family protein
MRSQLSELLNTYRSGWSLERPFYLDDSIFEAEWKHVWSKGWLFVATTAEIPNAGDFLTYTAHKDSIIVIRGKQGEVFAHYNTCRHRGSVICLEKHGNAKALRCPYHQWVYDIDGSLRSARLMPEDFDRSGFGLHPVHLRVVEGLIFISLAAEPPDFQPVLKDFSSFARPFQLDRAKIAFKATYDLRTNWKLIGENFRECYHCGVAHPEYCRAVIGANLLESAREVLAEREVAWREKGLAIEPVELTPTTSHLGVRYPLRPGWESYSLDGKPVSKLMGAHRDFDSGVVGIALLPNFWMDALSDHAWTMRVTPVSPSRTTLEVTWLVDGTAQEGVDYEVERLCAFWKATGGQDWTLCENNFRGIESSAYQPGPYAPAEIEVTRFVDWYIGRMTAEASPTLASGPTAVSLVTNV